jgi:hypothetical protein
MLRGHIIIFLNLFSYPFYGNLAQAIFPLFINIIKYYNLL